MHDDTIRGNASDAAASTPANDKPAVNIPQEKLNTQKITRADIDQAFTDRFERISREFQDGLNFARKHPKSVTFFGSARLPETDGMYQKARSLARKISCEGYAVISGGGPGIMEAANRGAQESNCIGPSLGMNIELPHEQVLNPYTDDHVSFYYFFNRKVALAFSAEAYLFFPGGFGTLDEFFEIVTLLQTRKIEDVPVILVGFEYWNKVDALIKEVLRDTYKTIDHDDTALYFITEDEDEIMDIIRNAPLREE